MVGPLAAPPIEPLVRLVPKSPAIRDPEARSRHPGYRSLPLAAVREMIRLQREVGAQLSRVTTPLQLIYSRRDPTVRVSDAERILRGGLLGPAAGSLPLALRACGHRGSGGTRGCVCQALDFLSELEARAAG